jgi:hypothetical protein
MIVYHNNPTSIYTYIYIYLYMGVVVVILIHTYAYILLYTYIYYIAHMRVATSMPAYKLVYAASRIYMYTTTYPTTL